MKLTILSLKASLQSVQKGRTKQYKDTSCNDHKKQRGTDKKNKQHCKATAELTKYFK